MCKHCNQKQPKSSAVNTIAEMYDHWIPKLNENLAALGKSVVTYAHIKREGRYTNVILIGEEGRLCGIGQSHQSLSDMDDPGLGLRIAWDRAVKEFVHDDTIHIGAADFTIA